MDHWLCCSAQGAQQAWAPPRTNLGATHGSRAWSTVKKKMGLQSYQRCCSLLLSLSRGFRHGEDASHPKNPWAGWFPSIASWDRAWLWNLLSEVMAASLEVLLQKQLPETAKIQASTPVLLCGASSKIHPSESKYLASSCWISGQGRGSGVIS